MSQQKVQGGFHVYIGALCVGKINFVPRQYPRVTLIYQEDQVLYQSFPSMGDALRHLRDRLESPPKELPAVPVYTRKALP